MREIELTQGKKAQVDDEDYEWLSAWKWYAHRSPRKTGDVWYAQRMDGRRTVAMHGELMKRIIKGNLPPGTLPDHEDGDGLNNQRHNLRLATYQQNQQNKRGKNKYKGVQWKHEWGLYQARITVDGEQMYLGYYETAEEAAHAYDRAALEHFGEFAKINFPVQTS